MSRIKGTNLYLDPAIVEAAKQFAEKAGKSLSDIVETELRKFNKRQTKRRAKVATILAKKAA